MHGILSLLDEDHTTKTMKIWDDLAMRCGLHGIEVIPFPHFSWQIAEDYDIEQVEGVLADLATRQKRFDIFTNGLAFFSGEQPVLYIPIVRSEGLSRLHASLWEKLEPLGVAVSALYAPEFWMPHITLTADPLDADDLSCLAQWLLKETFNWKININNYAFGFQLEGKLGYIRSRFDFSA